jgi:uncharacterized protein YwbE
MKLTNGTRYDGNELSRAPHATCPICRSVLTKNDPHEHGGKVYSYEGTVVGVRAKL